MIENRVENSSLIQLDLTDYKPHGERKILDIKEFLFEGVMVREKHFRELVEAYSWEQFEGCYVGITCSVDTIVPLWVYMILASKLQPYAKLIARGNLLHLEGAIFRQVIENMDVEAFKDKRVIVKGCGDSIPDSAYIHIASHLQAHVKTLMFGEACSTVPVFRAK